MIEENWQRMKARGCTCREFYAGELKVEEDCAFHAWPCHFRSPDKWCMTEIDSGAVIHTCRSPKPPAMPNRLDTVRAFIRNQAGLTDGAKPRPGPGRVELNHAEAMQVADWLDELAAVRRKQNEEIEWRGYKPEPAPEDRPPSI